MLAFVTVVGSDERYARYAEAGIAAIKAPEDVVLGVRNAQSLAEAYNAALDSLNDRDDLEAAVLLHDDIEIRDREFRDRLKVWVSEPDVAVVGALGARRVTSIAWWLGEGCGRLEESRGTIDFGDREGDVDAIDGLLMILSASAARTLRFDESIARAFHGYDVDLCFEARRQGGRVVVREMDIVHHTKGGFGDPRSFVATDLRWRSKWQPEQPLRARLRHLIRLAGVLVPRRTGGETFDVQPNPR